MTGSSSTKFETPRFSGSNYPACKLKMSAILVEDGYVVALKDKINKPEWMIDKVFAEKDELAMMNIYLALDEVVLFTCQRKLRLKIYGTSCKIYMKENQCRIRSSHEISSTTSR